MSHLRTSIIMKTDMVQSTPRISKLSQKELSNLLNSQKQFISDIVAKNEGAIIKGEGDAFWITFPSVTTAALAAIEMHQNLRAMQAGRGEHNRLAIRIIIAAGDVLHLDGDMFGLPVVLVARMESITPGDEIYLSHAAWLLLNKAEVPTSFVNEFTLKGLPESERVYKIEQKHQTRTIHDQYIVFTDVGGWTKFVETHAVEDIERVLLEYDDLITQVCEKYAGIIRNTGGDSYFLTFTELAQMQLAVNNIQQNWPSIYNRWQLELSLAVHKGAVNILRSYLFGRDINAASHIASIARRISHKSKFCVLVSRIVYNESVGTLWEARYHEVDMAQIEDTFLQTILMDYGAYQLLANS